jgi:hypothetical protein
LPRRRIVEASAEKICKSLDWACFSYARFLETEKRPMREGSVDLKERPLCSLPLCPAPADWFVESFDETEYYCDRHKPMVPQAFLKRFTAEH